MTRDETVAAVFREMAERGDNPCYCAKHDDPAVWCSSCLMRVAAEAWAEREKECVRVVEALTVLRVDANRLCDRQLGGTYEEDCRRAIANADAALGRTVPEVLTRREEPTHERLRDDVIGVAVECATCGDMKAPLGRSVPLGVSMCRDECSGYRSRPFPGSLWPGESEAQFGYPVGNDGTTAREEPIR